MAPINKSILRTKSEKWEDWIERLREQQQFSFFFSLESVIFQLQLCATIIWVILSCNCVSSPLSNIILYKFPEKNDVSLMIIDFVSMQREWGRLLSFVLRFSEILHKTKKIIIEFLSNSFQKIVLEKGLQSSSMTTKGAHIRGHVWFLHFSQCCQNDYDVSRWLLWILTITPLMVHNTVVNHENR